MQEAKSKTREPAISVLMAVYNSAQYLPAALDSILGQTFPQFELVVVDDTSTDDTPAILSAYARRDNRFVLLRNARNLKLAGSLNRGLQHCRAPLIARADSDDVCHPARLEKQIEFLGRHPEIGVISCSYNLIAGDGQLIGLHSLPPESAMIKFKLLWESSLAHAAAVYRAREVRAVGGYDERLATAQDYDLWSRLAERTDFANLAEPLLEVRTHALRTTTLHASETVKAANRVSARMISRYLSRTVDDRSATALRTLLCAYARIATEDADRALSLLDEVLKHAHQRESAATWRWVQHEVSASLLKQAHYLTYIGPTDSWRLLCRAVAIHPSRLYSSAGMLQIICSILRPLRFRRKGPRSASATSISC